MCEQYLLNSHLSLKGKQLVAAIKYEKSDWEGARRQLKSLGARDFSTLVNSGCIYFKQQKMQKALNKFMQALNIAGFNAELYYNVALCYYELHEYS